MSAAATTSFSGNPRARAVLLGGSAGALEALTCILAQLPDEFTLPLVALVHLPRNRKSALADALRTSWRRPIREPEDKEPLAPSTLYLAPPDYHLLIDPGPAFALSIDGPVHHSIPAIDLLFQSAAAVLGSGLAAVLLSGASQDGARGLRDVQQAGGLALVQHPGEAAYRPMPEAGLAFCPRARALKAKEIALCLREFAKVSSPDDRGLR